MTLQDKMLAAMQDDNVVHNPQLRSYTVSSFSILR